MLRPLPFLLLLLAFPALARPPRLTLFITVDAMGTDLLLRTKPRLKGGLRQLIDASAFYPYAEYGYAKPRTAPGHATLATGANPWRHGIVDNRIIDRATGKPMRVFPDPAHPVLEAPLSLEDVSPATLLAETFADRLRLSTQEQGKAIALSSNADNSSWRPGFIKVSQNARRLRPSSLSAIGSCWPNSACSRSPFCPAMVAICSRTWRSRPRRL